VTDSKLKKRVSQPLPLWGEILPRVEAGSRPAKRKRGEEKNLQREEVSSAKGSLIPSLRQ